MNKAVKIAFFGILIFGVTFNACRQLTQQYAISRTKCVSCYKCVSVCGYGAIKVDSTKRTIYDSEGFPFDYETTVTIDRTKCVGCGECYKSCPHQAISLAGMKEVDGTSGATQLN